MQTAAQAVTQALQSARNPHSGRVTESRKTRKSIGLPPSVEPLDDALTGLLWSRMAARYGHAWVSQYGTEPRGVVAAEWRDTLTGVTRDMLREGFDADAARGDDWPPSSTKFRALCFAIPSFEAIERQSRAGATSHSSFARLVHGFIDGWEYQRADADKARAMLKAAYQLATEHVLAGGNLPEEPVAYIGKPEPREKTPEETEAANRAAAHALAEMKKRLGIEA